MENLSEEEKSVLLALSALEPGTIEQIAEKAGLEPKAVQDILLNLRKRGLLK